MFRSDRHRETDECGTFCVLFYLSFLSLSMTYFLVCPLITEHYVCLNEMFLGVFPLGYFWHDILYVLFSSTFAVDAEVHSTLTYTLSLSVLGDGHA
jgi:hypothetical protein